MSIHQQQPPENDKQAQSDAFSLDPPRDLDYPHAPTSTNRDKAVMPLILSSLGLAFGILMLLARSPMNAPAFEQLTQYVCDAEPILQGRSLRASRGILLTCRSGEKAVLQRGLPTYSNNPAWTACRRSGGAIRIWRAAKPSPYGSYVFHATCDDHVIAYYPDRASTYESTQQFVFALASVIVLGSTIGLAKTLTILLRGRKTPHFS